MDEVTIRPAKLPDDLDQICDLYAETVDWHAENWPADFRKVDVRGSVREDLSHADGNSGLHLLVAEADGGRLAGLVTGSIRPRPTQAIAPYDGPVMHVNDLVVSASYRRRGIGAMLIKQLEQLAHQDGAVAITLHVHSQNETAGSFYQQQGFRPVQVEMRKDITP
ncbi:GNAT family N-acetyltransferase [Kribbella sp. NPDC049584]|uniref:GNAT family N-acetyltransferase n=1 Tax=Kribbella sp. NPDC049584 TaxID=3154833 RepID=UPI003424F9F5